MGSMFDIKRYLQKLRAYWPWWIVLAILLFVGGNAAGLLLPNKYSCRAIIRILQPLSATRDASLLDPRGELRVIRDRITSPTYFDQPDRNGRTIIGDLNLAKGLPRNSAEYQKIKKGIASRMTIWPRTENIVNLEYHDYTPDRAYDILTATINKWRTETEHSIGRTASSTKALLETQLRQAMDKLTSASQAVLAFKTAHPEVIPESYSEYRSRRDELIRSRTTNEQKIKAAQDSLKLLEARLQRETATVTTRRPASSQIPEIRKMEIDLAQMEHQKELLLQTLKENHHSIVDLDRKIALQKDLIAKTSKDPVYTVETQSNPAYQSLRDEYERMKMDINQTKTIIDEADKDIARLDRYIKEIPAKQLVLNDLINQERLYQSEVAALKTKLVSAEYITDPNFQNQFGFSIEEIEAPEKQLAPSAPNRKKIAAVSAVMSVAMVAAMVWLLMILDQALRSVDEARTVLRMPVLGVVQPIPRAGAKRKRIAA